MQISPAKKWCFTYNNPIQDWKNEIVPKIQKIGDFIIGEEVGESGTFHLQGFIEARTKFRPSALGLPKQIHWEKCRGSRQDNIDYCSKDGKYTTNMKMPRPLPEIELYGWQLKAKELFEDDPNSRSIYWFWSKAGSRGKSSFVRWAAMHGGLVCSGKAADMKYLVLKYNEKHGEFPINLIFDVPRSMQNYLSYQGIEELKNGVFASTKYECDMVVMPYPNVFVLANFEPDLEDTYMSKDRFVVTCVDDLSDESIYSCLRNPW